MEDIQIWSINGKQAVELNQASQMESENLLEDVLASNPSLLMEDLMLVGRQTPTEGGPLDLLGVDGDGRLVVFELKRGTLSRDAVAQVIDYASDLDAMQLDELANHISERSGELDIEKIEDFQAWYGDRGFDELESLKPLRMFLVGLGVDDRTERMVEFLANSSSMDISLLTFHGFQDSDRTLLAKQVDVRGDSGDEGGTTGGLSLGELLATLKDGIKRYQIEELFSAVTDLFQQNWTQSVQSVKPTGLVFQLPSGPNSKSGRYSYVQIANGRIRIIFYQRAIELCEDEFRQAIKQVPLSLSFPRGQKPVMVHFPLTWDDWQTHKHDLTTLIRSVYEAWQNSGSGE